MIGNATPVVVDVFLWGLDVSADATNRMRDVLSAEEVARADRFVRSSDRARWTVSRVGVRRLLGHRLGVTPQEIAFTFEEKGRPALAGVTSLSFNLSHSADVAALAISTDARVGVDVEEVKPMTDAEIAWALSPAEQQELSLATDADRLDTFFRFWTLKESFMKATGLGASLPLHDFDMSLNGARLARLKDAPAEPARWRFNETAPRPLMRGAVAANTEGRGLNVNWRWIQFD